MLSCLCLMVMAQERPRIGLVLSGGGAKGFAHVGALQVIEEAGIKIDYIGGTSMGAVIGGLYAAGYTAVQIDSLLTVIDIQEAIFGKQIRANHSIFDKTYGERYFLTLSISDFKLQIPAAISDGKSLQELLAGLLSDCDKQNDFNQLPIPFLCIGTRVVDGTEIVFEHGKLSEAIMASSAFPGLLPPVKIDGALITDGGILNNFPSKEIKDKGMDLVIGISVDKGLKNAEQLDNIYSIISQISFYESARRTVEQEQYCDLILHPDTEGYEVTSFSAKDILIENGRQAALKYLATLEEIGAYQRDELDKDEIQLQANGSDTVVQPPNSNLANPLDQIEHLSGLVRLGVHYDQIYHSSLLLNLTLQDFLLDQSTLSSNLVLGDNIRYGIHYLKRNVGAPNFGFNATLNYSDITIPLANPISLPDDLLLKDFSLHFRDQTTELYTNLISNRKLNFGLSAGMKYFKLSNDNIVSEGNQFAFSKEKNWYFSLSNFFYYDTKNLRYFTTRGTLIDASFNWIYPLTKVRDIQDKFSYNFNLTLEKYFPLSPKLTASTYSDGGVMLGQQLTGYNYFLGSINQNLITNWRPFIGLQLGDLIGTKFLRQSVTFQYRLRKNLFFTLSGNIVYVGDLINNNSSSQTAKSLGFRLGLDTGIGPIEVSYGTSNLNNSFNVTLGHWF